MKLIRNFLEKRRTKANLKEVRNILVELFRRNVFVENVHSRKTECGIFIFLDLKAIFSRDYMMLPLINHIKSNQLCFCKKQSSFVSQHWKLPMFVKLIFHWQPGKTGDGVERHALLRNKL